MISITDNHAPRLSRMGLPVIAPAVAEGLEAGADAVVEAAQFAIKDGAISGSGHVASLPGEPPNADTHVLDQSIHRGETVEIGETISTAAIADADYAAHLELGTTRMAERPFMRPAAAQVQPTLAEGVAAHVRAVRDGG